MEYITVKENKKLARHLASNAIINMDNNEYTKYIEERNKRNNDLARYNILEDRMAELKNDIDEIKNLLRGLIDESR